jgi:hypothetical protein
MLMIQGSSMHGDDVTGQQDDGPVGYPIDWPIKHKKFCMVPTIVLPRSYDYLHVI